MLLLSLLIISHYVKATSVGDLSSKLQITQSGRNYSVAKNLDTDLEYPGTDKTILQRVNKEWNEYYDCLNRKANEHNKPIIIRLIEGEYFEFQCPICPRPFQKYNDVTWMYKPLSSDKNANELQELYLNSHMLLTDAKTLKIFNCINNYEGLYVCYQGKTPVSVYILEASKNDAVQEVSLTQHNKQDRIYGKDFHLQVNYTWRKWSECSSCGVVGKKHKYGVCTVSIAKGIYRPRKLKPLKHKIPYTHECEKNFTQKAGRLKLPLLSNFSVYATTRLKCFKKNKFADNFKKIIVQQKNSKPEQNLTVVKEIIERFDKGIPCSSDYLPKVLVDFIAKKYKPLKAKVKYCLEPCIQTGIFEVLDDSGRPVETANNSAGIYSVFQKLPQLPPEIQRTSAVGYFGEDVVIQCPGTRYSNIPITWKINNKIIFPRRISNESKGRFTVDLQNRIHLKRLRLKDSHIYSCWQRDALVGTVSLKVDKNFTIGFNHHITLMATLAIIVTFLVVGVKIITRELKAEKKIRLASP